MDTKPGRNPARPLLTLWLTAMFILAAATPAVHAQPSAEADIRAAFKTWTDDFNARRIDKVCDLFAPDLISDYRGQPERGYEKQCEILKSSLTDPKRSFSYALHIKEIKVWSDIAVARIVWTLTIRQTDSGVETTVIEPGLDIFRREKDGRWRIIRYLAYDQE